MSDSIKIRPIRLDDHEQWLPLWQGYNHFYGRSGVTALPDEVTVETWGRFLDPKIGMFALVAQREGSLIGLAHYLFHGSTTALNPACYLQDLFTRQDQRKQGVARLLIAAVGRRAKEAGCQSVYWQTHESNSEARRLYDSLARQSEFLIYRMTT